MGFYYQTSGFSPSPAMISAVAQILDGTWINKSLLDTGKTTLLIVGGKVLKTEKILVALGAALPILDRKYLFDCLNSKRILDQESYDIGGKLLPGGRKMVQQTLAQRRRYRQESRRGQCQGWHVMVALEHASRRATYQRILESAGATVMTDWSLDALERVDPGPLTHIFSEPDLFWNAGPLQTFLAEHAAAAAKGRPFVGSYFYISEFLFADYVPDLKQYAIASPKMKVIHAKHTWQCSKDQEQARIQALKDEAEGEVTATYPIQRNASLPLAPNLDLTPHTTPIKRKGSDLNPENHPTKRLRSSGSAARLSSPLKPIVRRSSSRSHTHASSSSSGGVPKKVIVLDDSLSLQENNDIDQAQSSTTTPASNPAWKGFYDAVNVLGAVRQTVIYGSDIQSGGGNSYKICLDKGMPDEYTAYEGQFKSTVFNLIHGGRGQDAPEEKHRRWNMTLGVLESSLVTSTLPGPDILQTLLMKGLWHQEEDVICGEVHDLLTRWGHFTYPPIEEEICDVYLRALSRPKLNRESEFDPAEPLNFLSDLLDVCLESYGSSLILHWLVQILQMNFEHVYRTGQVTNSLVSHIIWPGLGRIILDRGVRKITESMFKALDKNNLGAFKNISGILCMIAQVFAKDDQVKQVHAKQSEFAREIFDAGKKRDLGQLKRITTLLQPRWLSLRISYLIVSDGASDSLLSLRQIVNSLSNPTTDSSVTKDAVTTNELALKDLDQNVTRNSVEQIPNPNKKNKYGETLVHLACKKGDLNKLAQLLNCKNVNINAKDNNGWTPLHEAVCHGQLRCVQMLLHAKNGSSCTDMLVQAGDHGMNAFHEAVENNFLDIVTEMIEVLKRDRRYPAFGDLMRVRSVEGKTAMDYAVSEEMKNLLLTQESAVIHVHFNVKSISNRLLTLNLVSKYISLFSLHYVKQELKPNSGSASNNPDLPGFKRYSAGSGGWGHSAKYMVWRSEKVRATDIRTYNSVKDSARYSQILLSFCKR